MTDEIPLLDADPDLGGALSPERTEEARERVRAPLVTVPRGDWNIADVSGQARGGFGLFMCGGLLVRRVTLAHRACAELLASGDLLRPWLDDGEHSVMPFGARYTALEALRLVVLDREASGHLLAFPELVDALVDRALARSRAALGRLVLAQLPRMDQRLLILLWHLADRFGRVRRDGVLVPLPLSHELLGQLVGGLRPSVTTTLGELAERGLVTRVEEGWLLTREPPPELSEGAPEVFASP